MSYELNNMDQTKANIRLYEIMAIHSMANAPINPIVNKEIPMAPKRKTRTKRTKKNKRHNHTQKTPYSPQQDTKAAQCQPDTDAIIVKISGAKAVKSITINLEQ